MSLRPSRCPNCPLISYYNLLDPVLLLECSSWCKHFILLFFSSLLFLVPNFFFSVFRLFILYLLPIPFLCFCVYSLIISSPPRLPYPLLSFDGLVRLSRRNQININLTCNANIAFDCRDWRLTTRPGITVDS